MRHRPVGNGVFDRVAGRIHTGRVTDSRPGGAVRPHDRDQRGGAVVRLLRDLDGYRKVNETGVITQHIDIRGLTGIAGRYCKRAADARRNGSDQDACDVIVGVRDRVTDRQGTGASVGLVSPSASLKLYRKLSTPS
jgi:hypothetical protein